MMKSEDSTKGSVLERATKYLRLHSTSEFGSKTQLQGRQCTDDKITLVNSNRRLSDVNHSFRLDDVETNAKSGEKSIQIDSLRLYPERSLNFFHIRDNFRQFAIALVETTLFHWFVLSGIVFSIVAVVLANPHFPNKESPIVDALNTVLIVLLSIEWIFRFIAWGMVYDPHAYLRNSWNATDFGIVLMWLLSQLLKNTMLNHLSVILPLRIVFHASGFRNEIRKFGRKVPLLLNAMLLLSFFLLTWGLVGTQLFSGILRQHCRHDTTGILDFPNEFEASLCGAQQCSTGYSCVTCTEGDVCSSLDKMYPNPAHGSIGFDHLPLAILTIFQCITMEGWSDIMYMVQDTGHYVSFLYFVVLIVFGSFFIIQLMLAAINDDPDKGINDNTAQMSVSRTTYSSTELTPVPEKIEEKVQDTGNFHEFFLGCEKIINTPWFNKTIQILILINTALLCVPYYGMNDTLADVLYYSNIVFLVAFGVEMVMKLFGLGIRGYFKDWFNVFDGVIVIIGIFDIAAFAGKAGPISSLRVLRVIKLMKYYESLQRLLHVIKGSLSEMKDIFLLLCLCVLIYGAFGYRVFGNKFEYVQQQDQKTQYTPNFDTLFWSVITVFQVLTIENWNSVLAEAMDATSPVATLYFISWIFLGVFILLNVFLSIILQNFARDQSVQNVKKKRKLRHIDKKKASLELEFAREVSKKDVFQRRIRVSENKNFKKQSPRNSGLKKMQTAVKNLRSQQTQELDLVSKNSSSSDVLMEDGPLPDITISGTGGIFHALQHAYKKRRKKEEKQKKKLKKDLDKAFSWKQFCSCRVHRTREEKGKLALKMHKRMYSNPSYDSAVPDIVLDCCYSDKEWFLSLSNFVRGERFSNFIIGVIFISSIILAIDSPNHDPDSFVTKLVELLDIVFAAIFLCEMLLKILVQGFVGYPDAYLNTAWNQLDCFIVISSVLTLTLKYTIRLEADYLNLLRLLRAFRPLRLLSRFEGMRVVINALFRCLPQMLNVLAVMMLVWTIFSILAVDFFAGTFYSCSETITPQPGLTDEMVCINQGYEWINSRVHFDNSLEAALALFAISTTEGWLAVMWDAVSSTQPHYLPSPGNKPHAAIFFVIFIFIGSFLVISLFVGVVFDNFTTLRDEYTGLGLLSAPQKRWVESQLLILKASPTIVMRKPKAKWRHRIYHIAMSLEFEKVIMAAISLNVLLMTFGYLGQPKYWAKILDVMNIIFAVVFLIEAIIKIVGFGFSAYIKDDWNKFDFGIVLASIVEVVVGSLGSGIGLNFGTIRILKVLRVSRLIRLVKRAKKLKMMLQTLVISLPSLVNVGTLLLIMYFIYSVLGVHLFGKIENGRCMTEHANFRYFPSAFLTMFRASTGEQWQCIMNDTRDVSKGGFRFSWIYFVSFVLLVNFITVNLFIAVILDNFSEVSKSSREDSDHHWQLTPDMVAAFVDSWAKYDPNGTRYIDASKLRDVLREVPKPLGIRGNESEIDILKMLSRTTIPLHGLSQIHFSETLYSLAYNICGLELPESKLQRDITRRLQQRLPHYGSDRVIGVDVFLVVLKAQRIFRNRRNILHARKQRKRANELQQLGFKLGDSFFVTAEEKSRIKQEEKVKAMKKAAEIQSLSVKVKSIFTLARAAKALSSRKKAPKLQSIVLDKMKSWKSGTSKRKPEIAKNTESKLKQFARKVKAKNKPNNVSKKKVVPESVISKAAPVIVNKVELVEMIPKNVSKEQRDPQLKPKASTLKETMENLKQEEVDKPISLPKQQEVLKNEHVGPSKSGLRKPQQEKRIKPKNKLKN